MLQYLIQPLGGKVMRMFGSEGKRTYHDYRVVAAGFGKKIKFTVGVKNRKIGRPTWVKEIQSYIES